MLTLEARGRRGGVQAGDRRARRAGDRAEGARPATRPEPPASPRRGRQGPGRRARRRPGRLHGRVPRRRPRAERRPDRPRRAARRRLPERRLHPVQGAAARRQGHDRGRRAGRVGHHVRAPKIDLDKVRGWKNNVVGKLTGGLERPRQAAQGPGRARHRRVHRPEHDQGRRHRRRLRALHHRRGLGGGVAAVPARGPADHRLHRRAGGRRRSRSGCWSSAAASSASRWRRSTTRSAPRSRSSSCSTS